ncbi:hypothetical protein QI30_04185 [Kurthia sp. 3B1D]|uniref:Uncharacterized protein n=1 Tax=Candidatus Kurthia intestinigallinarum TaxID=1562256 RepID=A0A433RWU6_9BACL|nr:hypothetical protein QI30_04185 [Kurthia sp. 3B1D]
MGLICFIPHTEIAPNPAHGDAALKKINDRHSGTMFSSKEYPYYDIEDFSSLKIYTVKDHTQLIHPENGLGSKQHPKLTKKVGTHEKLWQRFKAVIPEPIREDVKEFEIFTDGHGEYYGYVSPLNFIQTQWRLSFDIQDFTYDKKLFYYGIIHESAHLIGFDDSQHNDTAKSYCTNYQILERCANDNSYTQLFYEQFWTKEMVEEAYTYAYDSVENRSYASTKNFVTPYAMNNVDEDFAESFSYFIFSKRPTDLKKIKHQKIEFFYQFEELIKLRNELLHNIERDYR